LPNGLFLGGKIHWKTLFEDTLEIFLYYKIKGKIRYVWQNITTC